MVVNWVDVLQGTLQSHIESLGLNQTWTNQGGVMRGDSVLLLVFMVLKLITVVPMAFESMGVGYAMLFCLFTMAGYGALVYLTKKQSRIGGMANG